MNGRFEDYQVELANLASRDRRRELVQRRPAGIHFEQDGRRLVNFGSNDYLGLAGEPLVALESCQEVPIGSGASGLVSGWTNAHEQLVEAICQLEGTQSAVVFPSGYAACSGTVATLAREGDLILSDQLNHASLIDGCRLSRAKCLVYPHRDTNVLASLLDKNRSSHQRAWIVTDGVFSMDGHVAPLAKICEVSERFDAELMVDEAHATGVLGERGSGLCEAQGVKDQVSIRIGTLSKAVGVQGGFVAGPKSLIDYLINRCRTLIYSTSLSPVLASVAARHCMQIQNEPQRRDRIKELTKQVRTALGAFSACPIEQSIPIVPVMLGEERLTLEAAEMLFQQGFYVPPIRPPTVPKGTSRLRVSLSAAHSNDDINGLIDALQLCLKSQRCSKD